MTRRAPGARALGIATVVCRHRGGILGLALVLAAVASSVLVGLELDVGLVSMLPQGRARFAAYQEFVERFGVQDVAIALIRAEEGTDRSELVGFADAFSESLARSDEVLAVRGRADADAFAAALGDGALPLLLPDGAYREVRPRLAPAGVRDAVAGWRRALAAPGAVGVADVMRRDPLGLTATLGAALARSRPDRALAPEQDHLISPDQTALVLIIQPRHGGFSTAANEELAAALQGAEEEARGARGGAPGIRVGYTGAFAHSRADAALIRADIRLYVILALVLVVGVFLAGYRNLRIVPYVTAHIAFTTLITLALGAWAYGRINVIALAFTAIFYGLSIDAAIHFYTRFVEERSRGIVPAVAATIEHLFAPTLIASISTAAAFALIGFSDLEGVAQLGFLTAVGLLLNVPATFFVLPAWMSWVEGRVLAGAANPTTLPRLVRLGALAATLRARRGQMATLCVLLLAASAVAARELRLDTDLFHLRPSHTAPARVDAALQKEFGFTNPLGAVLLSVDGADAARLERRQEALVAAERATAWLLAERETGRVETVTSPVAIMPSMAEQRRRLEQWKALPREAAASRLETELAAAGFRREPFADALRELRRVPAPVDFTTAVLPGLELLFSRHVARDARGFSLLVPFSPRDASALASIERDLTEHLAGTPNVRVVVTGRPLMEQELRASMREEVTGFLATVSVLCFGLVWLRERRVARAFVMLAVPAGTVVGLLGLAAAVGIVLNPVNMIVLPLVIGIGLDDCLFLAERCREHGDVARAVERGGRALAITTGTTVAGFGVLALSEYPALRSLGQLAAPAMVLCFLVTLVVLPTLLDPTPSGERA